MRKCIGCGYGCRNRCSNCGRGWCATCRDALGRATCSVCIANKAHKQQVALQRAQQRKAAAAASKALEAKIEHDSAYLSRRAARGSNTATDALLSSDLQGLQAILETVILEIDEYLIPKSNSLPKDISHTELLMNY
jgi:hypothetical protein